MRAEPAHFRLGYRETIKFYASAMVEAESVSKGRLDEIMKQLGQTDLFFLLVFILKRIDLAHPWLFARCREVQRDPDNHLDLWAREHYKSTVITFGLTIFDIINDPEVTACIFSHTKGIARKFLAQIKAEMEQNTDLPRLWPDVFFKDPKAESPKWSVDEGIIVKRKTNPKEATLEAHGLVDGQPTSRHFKTMIYDDVVTLESVNTPDQIEKTTTALRMSDNLGSVGGRRRYIGTRYHLFDTYRTMLDEGMAKLRCHPATHNGLEYGEPVLMPKEVLAEKRIKQGAYVFASQMLLNPTADKAMGFRREWLVFEDVDRSNAMRSLFRFIIVDPSGGKQRKNNDYTTMLVIGFGADGKFRILDMRRDRMSLTTKANTLIELHREWKPNVVAWEEYGMQADIEFIKYRQKELMYEFDIIPLGGSMSKELRILRLVPYFENGYKDLNQGGDGIARSRIILPTSCYRVDYQGHSRDLVKDFVEQEYTAFPVLSHDDMLDCLARLIDLLELGVIETPKALPPPSRRLDNLGKTQFYTSTGDGGVCLTA